MNELNRHDASRGRAVLEDDYEYIEVEEAAGLDYPGGVMMSPGVGMSDRTRWIITVALVAAALVCWFALLPHFSSPEAHADVFATIDEKIDNVLTLTAGSAGASALISAIPGDAGSPIAEKLMDLSTGFLIVLAALFLEKYLITIFSAAALGFALPVAALLGVAFVWMRGRSPWAKPSLIVGGKLTALGVVLLLAIPTSTWVTNQIDTTYETSMQESIERAEQLSEGAAQIEEEGSKKGDEGIIDAVTGFFTGIFDTVSKGVGGMVDGAKDALNQFIESLAVMLVTSCLIPILVLLFYFWVAKIVLGVNIDVPTVASALSPRRVRRRVSDAVSSKDRA